MEASRPTIKREYFKNSHNIPVKVLNLGSRTAAVTWIAVAIAKSLSAKRCTMASPHVHLKVTTVGASSLLNFRWSSTKPRSIGYKSDDVDVFSAESTAVAICSDFSTGRRSAIISQCSSFSSSVLASAGFTMFRSLTTAHTVARTCR